MPARAPAPDAPSLASDAEPVFRVVEGQGTRRGVRLERVYWQALRDIARARQEKLATLVKHIVEQAPETANMTSLLRVYCLSWMKGALEEAHRRADPAQAASLVRASPGATFALGLDRRIIAYNQAFLNFVQARFSYAQTGPIGRDLRLSLDVHLSDLTTTLKGNGNTPVTAGFVVGVGERRLRGNLNTVLAPVLGQDIVLCYVLP